MNSAVAADALNGDTIVRLLMYTARREGGVSRHNTPKWLRRDDWLFTTHKVRLRVAASAQGKYWLGFCSTLVSLQSTSGGRGGSGAHGVSVLYQPEGRPLTTCAGRIMALAA
jgi:hypothetical protein